MPSNIRGEHSLIIACVFTVLAFGVVLLRMYTRLFMVRAHGIEDHFITASLIFSIALTICIGFQVRYGMGQHMDVITNGEDSISMMKAFYASILVYNTSLSFTKISILLQYRRIFQTPRFTVICWVLLVIAILYGLSTFIGSIFQCVPVSAFWTQEHSKCINMFASWFFNAAMNIFMDLAILILPMPVLKNLNLPRRQKYLLIGVFATGGIVCVVSILRLHALIRISDSMDPTFDNPLSAAWSAVEVNVSIVCSSLPCIRPILARWLPRVFASTPRSAATTTWGNLPGSVTFERSKYRRQNSLDIALASIEKALPGSPSDVESQIGSDAAAKAGADVSEGAVRDDEHGHGPGRGDGRGEERDLEKGEGDPGQ